MFKRAMCVFFFALSVAALTAGMGTSGEKKNAKDPKYNNPTFVPTADEVIEKMFEMAKVNEKDVIFDLGCGDNRICFMAGKKYGCRGVGLELNPVRIKEAMDLWEKKYSDLKTLVETRHGDALRPKDLKDATVVVMYMFPEFMELWFPIAEKTLKPGTRILSHDYSWDYEKDKNKWAPVATATVKSASRDNHKVLMWVVPEKKKATSR
ncbi:MAG TPA: class I SAM-dependent methyltransferase [Gemmataceae bacterium]|nr:class I SAM-dependent methyltransferase [Gemmataceae bacterium]